MDWFFITIYFGNLLNYIDRGIVATLLPKLAEEFTLSKVEQGFLASSFMIGYALFSVVASILASRWNRRALLTCGTCIWGFSCLIMASAESTATLYVARAISGVGEATYQSVAPVLLAEAYGDHGGTRKMSIFYTAINIGFAFGILLGGIFTRWRILYFIELVCSVIAIIGLYYMPRHFHELKKEEAEPTLSIQQPGSIGSLGSIGSIGSEWTKVKQIYKSSQWWYGTIANMFITYTFGVISLWMPSYYKETFSDQMPYSMQAGLLAITLLISGTIGSILGDRLPKYYAGDNYEKPHTLFALCGWACILCLPCITVSVGWTDRLAWSVGWLSIALTLFAFLTIPNGMITVTSVPVECRSYATSLGILAIHIGGDMPSPIISSIIWERTHNLKRAILISCGGLVLAALIYARAYKRLQPRIPSAQETMYRALDEEYKNIDKVPNVEKGVLAPSTTMVIL